MKKTVKTVTKTVLRNVIRGATSGFIHGIGSLFAGAINEKADDLVNQLFESKKNGVKS